MKNTINSHTHTPRYVVSPWALSLEYTMGPISEGETRIEEGKRARIDGVAQEKEGSPSPENCWDLNWKLCKLVYIWSVI